MSLPTTAGIKNTVKGLIGSNFWINTGRFACGAVAATITLLSEKVLITSAQKLGWLPQNSCAFWKAQVLSIKQYVPFTSALSEKTLFLLNLPTALVLAPIVEELLFRKEFQDTLTQLMLAKHDPRSAKLYSIVVTSALFAAGHLMYKEKTSIQTAVCEATIALIGGLVLGILKESPVGLYGAIGCHMLHNTVEVIKLYLPCLP